MGWTELHRYIYKLCGDLMATLVDELPRLKSIAKAEGYPDGINGDISMIKTSIQL